MKNSEILNALQGFDQNRKRLRYDVAKRWTPAMRAALRTIEADEMEGAVEATFDLHSSVLVATFPRAYPFHCVSLQIDFPAVARPREVLLATRSLPPVLQGLIAEYLVVRRRKPLKRWLYDRTRTAEGGDAAADVAQQYTELLPPYVWSPATDLSTYWDAVHAYVGRVAL